MQKIVSFLQCFYSTQKQYLYRHQTYSVTNIAIDTNPVINIDTAKNTDANITTDPNTDTGSNTDELVSF